MERKYDHIRGVAGRRAFSRVSAAVLAVVAAVIFWFSANVVWSGDDIGYRYMIENNTWTLDLDNPRPVTDLGDLAVSQINHYFYNSGRTVAHVFVQLFCGPLGHYWFGACNALMWLLFIWSVMKAGGARMGRPAQVLTATCLVVLSYMTHVVPSIQIGYVWMGALVMGFVNLFFSAGRCRTALLPFLFLFGLVAGDAQDAYNIGIAVALAVHTWRNRAALTVAQWVMFAGFIVGVAALCLSPGNLSRADGYRNGIVESVIVTILSLRSFYILVIVVLWKRFRHGEKWRGIYSYGPFLWNVMAVCVLLNMVLTVRSNRQLFGIELMSMVLLIRMLPQHAFTVPWRCLFVALALLYWGFQARLTMNYGQEYDDICSQYVQSADGRVYVDTRTALPRWSLFEYPCELWGRTKSSYSSHSLRVRFREMYPGQQPLLVLPVDSLPI